MQYKTTNRKRISSHKNYLKHNSSSH